MQDFMIQAIIGTEILIVDKKLIVRRMNGRTNGQKVELLYNTRL